MLILKAAADIVRATTTAATATLSVQASWVKMAGTTPTLDRAANQVLTGAVTNTTLIAAPTGTDAFTVKGIVIHNTHATLSQTIDVRHFDGTTDAGVWNGTLLPSEMVVFDGNQWVAYDASNNPKSAARTGRYLRTTLILNGTTAFVTGPDTTSIFCRLQAGGGGGGGCTSVASAAGAAGGGSAGGYAEKTFAATPNTSYVVAVGAGGTGASGAAGNAGGITTVAVGGVTVTANGGLGGPQCVPLTTLKAYLGAATPAVSTNGDLNSGGCPGSPGIILIVTGSVGVSGNGGDGIFGVGAIGVIVAGAGVNATVGYGGGGSGSLTAASAARAGGNGANGALMIDEFA